MQAQAVEVFARPPAQRCMPALSPSTTMGTGATMNTSATTGTCAQMDARATMGTRAKMDASATMGPVQS